jgi:Cu/Ag efflux pump CusA
MLLVILIIFVTLFSSFGSVRQALPAIMNIRSALVGGIVGLLPMALITTTGQPRVFVIGTASIPRAQPVGTARSLITR